MAVDDDHIPSDAEIMDPQSRYFSPDWWMICDLEKAPQCWDRIVYDFRSAYDVIEKLRGLGFDQDGDIHIEPFELENRAEIIDHALTTSLRLMESIAHKISYKLADADFAFQWGEFQKAVSILSLFHPVLKKESEQAEAGAEGKKDDARLWYTLWFDWYCENPMHRVKTRVAFDHFFEPFLQQLRDGKLKSPDEHATIIAQFLREMKGEQPEDQVREKGLEKVPPLPRSFKAGRLTPSVMGQLKLKSGDKLTALPPVGIEHYLSR